MRLNGDVTADGSVRQIAEMCGLGFQDLMSRDAAEILMEQLWRLESSRALSADLGHELMACLIDSIRPYNARELYRSGRFDLLDLVIRKAIAESVNWCRSKGISSILPDPVAGDNGHGWNGRKLSALFSDRIAGEYLRSLQRR